MGEYASLGSQTLKNSALFSKSLTWIASYMFLDSLSFSLYYHRSLIWTSVLCCPDRCPMWSLCLQALPKNPSLSHRLVYPGLTFGQQVPLQPCQLIKY